MLPTLSIIVPVHNVARYLPACIDSILEQECEGIEVVLVNDCSTDDSAAICDRYAAQSASVRVIHSRENQGVAAARNHGLAAATGDYVMFVDGDDCLVPGSLARVRREIDRLGPIDIVICRYNSESKVLSNAAMFVDGLAGRKLEADGVLTHLTGIDFYLDHCWPYVISHALIDRHKVRFINSMIAEDAEYIVRTLVLASTIAYCEGDFYLYRERDGSLKNSKGAAPTVSFLHVAHAMRQVMEEVGRSHTEKAFVASQIRHTLGVFSARLSLLDNAELGAVSSMVQPEHLAAVVPRVCSQTIADALIAYRNATDAATLALVPAANGQPVFIYCAGPSAAAVIRALQGAKHDVRAIIDDNAALRGRALLDVPVVAGDHLETLSASDRAAALIVICIQKRAACEKITAALKQRGFAANQIVHRMF
jgi:glycosyltransferase involved in cell wall biosynthesis